MGTLQKKTTDKASMPMKVVISRVYGTVKVQVMHWKFLKQDREVELKHFRDGRDPDNHLVQ